MGHTDLKKDITRSQDALMMSSMSVAIDWALRRSRMPWMNTQRFQKQL
uniref:Uncharacterized protein n=1 Tax=Anguilla anguilla TaxID=7936 RepID=A0A0E9SYR1_ANGAN